MTKKEYIALGKWMYLVIGMDKFKGKSLNTISQKVNITYSHCYHMLKQMKNDGWVMMRKRGRMLDYEFTLKGEAILKGCKSIFKEIKGEDYYLLNKTQKVI